MSTQSRLLRGGARAAVGLIVVGVAASAVLLLNNATLPAVAREPLAITVDTTLDTARTLVCAGSFTELGADPSRPGVAIPTGAPAVTIAGKAEASTELTRVENGTGLPTVLTSPADVPLGAAQIQAVTTEVLRGTAASSCTEPVNEQWLLGGSTTLGVSTTLSLANPGKVPATVQITVYDENGPVDAVQTSGVLVAPGEEQIVSLNGYAPERERLAVQVSGIQPFAVSSVTRQLESATTLVVPGITNVSTDTHEHTDNVVDHDEFPVAVRVLAPGGETATATVRAIDKNGKSTNLGDIALSDNGVGELIVEHWPEQANAVVIEADAPVIGGVRGSSFTGSAHDYEWFTPAPTLQADTPVAVPVVGGGKLVIANTGESEANIEYTAAGGKTRKAVVPDGASIVVNAAAKSVLTSSAPVTAGLRYLGGADIAGYPVLPALSGTAAPAVYTR